MEGLPSLCHGTKADQRQAGDPVPKTASMETPRVCTVDEIAALTGFHRDTITKMFENEPGVLILERPGKMNKRRYRSIRIPLAVYERVIRRYEV